MDDTSTSTNSFFVYILAVIFPLLLIPIELIFPYPAVIEEIAKAILVLLILKTGRVYQAVLVGFLFSLSENILYLTNIFNQGGSATFLQRFLLTTPLHITTALICYLLVKRNRHFLIPALILMILIHFFYNVAVLLVVG